jgi:hypothetical protein
MGSYRAAKPQGISRAPPMIRATNGYADTSLLSETVFDPPQTRMVCDAFDAAWAHLQGVGSAPTDPAKASITRTMLAKRIIEMAHRDDMNQVEQLRDDALAHHKNNSLFNRIGHLVEKRVIRLIARAHVPALTSIKEHRDG